MKHPSDLKDYSKILLKGSAAVTLADASIKVIGMILLPIYTYYLTPRDYGTVSVVILIMTFLNLLYNPGMVSATQRLYHDTEVNEEKMELIGSAFIFFLIIPIIPTILGLVFGKYVTDQLFSNFVFYPFGLLALLLAFFTQPKRIFIALMTLRYKIHLIAIYSFIAVLLSLLTTIILVVFFKMGGMGKVLGLFPGALFFFYLSFKGVYKFTNGSWSLKSIKTQLKFGAPLIVGIWSYEILHIADRYIIERMTNLESLGLYSFSYQISEAPMMLILGVQQLWNPIYYENMNRGNFKTVSRLSLFYIFGFSFIIILLILFIKEITLLLINERYYATIILIPIIVIGIFFNGLLVLTNSVIGFKKKFGLISIISFIAAGLNVILNIYLIPIMGIAGSAVATLISYAVYFTIAITLSIKDIKKLMISKLHAVPIVFVTLSYILIAFLSFSFDNHVSPLEIVIKLIFLSILFIASNKLGLIEPNERSAGKIFLKEYIYRIKMKFTK